MTGVIVALYLAAVRITEVPFRPVVVAVVLIGGFGLGDALTQLHAWRPAHPGRLGVAGRVLSRTMMVVVYGVVILLARNLDAERAERMLLGLCALAASAAGYRRRRDGRFTRPGTKAAS